MLLPSSSLAWFFSLFVFFVFSLNFFPTSAYMSFGFFTFYDLLAFFLFFVSIVAILCFSFSLLMISGFFIAFRLLDFFAASRLLDFLMSSRLLDFFHALLPCCSCVDFAFLFLLIPRNSFLQFWLLQTTFN